MTCTICSSQFPKMVGWYNPFQLIKTGIQVAISTLLGSRADSRVILSVMAEGSDEKPSGYECKPFDYTDRQEVWIDYVADLGDGWNSTYAVAYLLARDELPVRRHDGEKYTTRRGDILIMGGDEVYPVASRENYEKRLITPYEAAFPKSSESEKRHPHLFAIPGNHDWYDGLASFMRLFCQTYPPRWIGGWHVPQTRSYFAVKLPHKWWLVGVDIQLEADIDGPQLEYFRQIVEQKMQEGDRIILCTPTPDWIYRKIYDVQQNNLVFLEQEVFQKKGARVVLKLSGDLHHYRRHESSSSDGSSTHLIIAGGGGAFLHPTHGPNVDRLEYGNTLFELKAEYPERRTTCRLAWRNLLFPLWNPWFGILTGFVYTALNWIMPHELYKAEKFREALWGAFKELMRRPSGLVWVLLITLAFVLFTDTHKKWYRWCGGIAHALAHLLAALVVAWGAHYASVRWCGIAPDLWWYSLVVSVLTFFGGWIVGSEVMGLYVLGSLNIFKRHANEAFSSLRIQDYKNFLRLHLASDGTLTIYPIGIDRVPRRWYAANPPEGSRYLPKEDLTPHLIEGPVVIP
jgi:hypothetical protein